MKKSLKVKEISQLFGILGKAGYSQLDDESKIKIWKTVRSMKSVADKFDEDKMAASQEFTPKGDFVLNYQRAQAYEKAEDKSTVNMTEDEYKEFLKEFISFTNLVNKAVEDLGNTEVEIDVYPLDENGLSKLMASNNWDMSQVLLISDFIVEN